MGKSYFSKRLESEPELAAKCQQVVENLQEAVDRTLELKGWCDFQNIYDEAVQNLGREGAIFVEVGAFLGVSTIHMASQLKQFGKMVKFFVVDFWDSTDLKPTDGMKREIDYFNENIEPFFTAFIRNLDSRGLLEYIRPLRVGSAQAAGCFLDNSVSFCFIDAAHDYDSVRQDLEAWAKKIKKGGLLAGHDYVNDGYPEVAKAVDEMFGSQVVVDGTSWKVYF